MAARFGTGAHGDGHALRRRGSARPRRRPAPGPLAGGPRQRRPRRRRHHRRGARCSPTTRRSACSPRSTEAVTIPVVAGTGSNDTAHSVHLTEEAAELGVAGILAVCPYYNRPSQAGIEAHFRAIAAATDLPVVLYDIPVRTGRKIATATLLRLAREVPNIVRAQGRRRATPARPPALIADAPDGFEVYSGDDSHDPAAARDRRRRRDRCGHALDGRGPPGDVRPLGEGRRRGRPAGQRPPARELRLRDRRRRPNPIPTKAMLRHLGLPVGQARLPMGDAPAWVEASGP